MQTQSVRLDQGKLKQITNASHTAVVTMLLLALRERARGFSNITATKEQLIRMGEKIVDEDFQSFWKSLQDAGIGAIVYGRRGRPDRFQWHYSLKAIARVAIEGREELVKELAKKKPKRVVRKPVSAKPVSNKPRISAASKTVAEKLVFTIALKNGLTAEVTLPKGASDSEIERVCQALTR